MRKLATVLLGSAAVLALTAGPALAAVDFDPATGTGFAGKGDVKDALRLTEKQLQSTADSISFFTTSTREVSFTCEDEVERDIRLGNNGIEPSDGRSINGLGRRQKITVILTDSHSVTDTVVTEVTGGTRKNPQMSVTGFHLTGFGDAVSSGGAPAEGDACEGVDDVTGEAFTGTATDVVIGAASEPALHVTDGTSTALLPNTPVATTTV